MDNRLSTFTFATSLSFFFLMVYYTNNIDPNQLDIRDIFNGFYIAIFLCTVAILSYIHIMTNRDK